MMFNNPYKPIWMLILLTVIVPFSAFAIDASTGPTCEVTPAKTEVCNISLNDGPRSLLAERVGFEHKALEKLLR